VPEIRKFEDTGETSTAPLEGGANVAAGGRALHARASVGAYVAIESVNTRAAQARQMRRRVMKTMLTPGGPQAIPRIEGTCPDSGHDG
jgi:hypothetical protein